MQELFTHLINQAYRVYQGKLIPEIIKPVNISYYLEFGGFELNYNWYGRTRIAKELIGKLKVYRKTIHVDIRFAYYLANLTSSDNNYQQDYNLNRLIHTLAHEVAHCVISDYGLLLAEEHSEAHEKLTEELEQFLWSSPEVQELAKLQRDNKKLKRLVKQAK